MLNQIDHMLIDVRHKSDILDISTLRGPNIDLNHHLVWARVRTRILETFKTARNTT